MTVNTENVGKWLTALRSGEYDQATGKLRELNDNGDVVGYCCLGVACEISGLGTWEGEDYLVNGVMDPEVVGLLPVAVREWLGFDTSNPALDVPEDEDETAYSSATEANDDYGLSFGEIADAIEAQYVS